MNGKAALRRLVEGNKRFAVGKFLSPNRNTNRVREVAKDQNPFAVIVGCSDSRVGPEIIFDQGLGDLFIIRNAGNIVDDYVLGSIEYAVDYLRARLVVVLGHKRCGAVSTAVNGAKLTKNINAVIDEIKPSVEIARTMNGDILDKAIKLNIEAGVQKIKSVFPSNENRSGTDKIIIAGAQYDLDNGQVTFYH